jgi:YD repeat-containing protein
MILAQAKNTAIDQPCVECGDAKSRSYDANGNPFSQTDWNGTKTCFSYDTTRNLETVRLEGTAEATACGTSLALTTLVVPMHKSSTQWHAVYRLPTAIAEPNKRTYDDHGNLLARTEQATTDATGASGFAAQAVGSARTWRYSYNDVGQVLTATDPLGAVSRYTYDSGNLATVTDAAGQVTTLSHYDANGRAGKIVDANGSVTLLAYSPRGWLTSRTTGGETTTYDYDGVGQLTRVTWPDGAFLAYTYDDAHRLTAIADQAGNRIAYTLDLRGNRTAEQVSDPDGTLTRRRSRLYDALNRLQQATGIGQ